MIRTITVEIPSISAIAYRQKLTSGGSGITILSKDEKGVATIDKRTGEAVAYGKINEILFTKAVFAEAIALTRGLPFANRPAVSNPKNIDNKISAISNKAEKVCTEKAKNEESKEIFDSEETSKETIEVVTSDEYNALVTKYTDKKGYFSFELMNKDFIQFAAKSKIVADMTSNKASEKDILIHVIQVKTSELVNRNKTISNAKANQLISMLNDISDKSAFKELKLYIRKMLGKK